MKSQQRPKSCACVAACIMASTVAAAQDAVESIDIFGVYTPPIFRNMPPVTQPDVYPFTAQAQAFFDTYDPAAQDARSVDD